MEFKTKKEWLAEAKRLRGTGLSAPEVAKKLGTFTVDGKTYAIHNKGTDGITSVDMEGRKARGNKRNAAIKEQDVKLLETLKKGGMDDAEAKAILKKEKAGYKRIEHQAAALNKEHGKGAFNAGHETAALEGGGNYGRNARVEIGKSRTRADGTKMRGNQSRGRIDEAPDSIKPAMGIPRSGRGGEDTAIINLLEKDMPGIMDLGLTPQDKQNIKRNPAGADDIIAARQARLQPTLEVRGGNIKIKPIQAVRAARGLSPMWGSLPIGIAAVGMSGQSALANPTAETIEDVGWDVANLAADAATLIPTPWTVAGGEALQKTLGVAQQARMGQRELAKQEGLPEPIKKFVKDPLNELEHAGNQVMGFLGDALKMGSEAGY